MTPLMAQETYERRKTMTRRLVKLRDPSATYSAFSDTGWPESMDEHGDWRQDPCPYGVPGDRLWVRESVARDESEDGQELLVYRGGGETWVADWASGTRVSKAKWKTDAGRGLCWKPNIHMPRWACRSVLEVVSRRVERLQDISEADAIAEGCNAHETRKGGGYSAKMLFAHVWEGIHGPGSWDLNPRVWVVQYKRLDGVQP